MNDTFFSIIIPTKQRHDTLRYSIQSVLNQSYHNYELIVSDNFSSPETYEVVSSFDEKKINYHRTLSSLSMADNWEFGLSQCKGEYIFVLGDDDALMPDGLEIANNLIAQFGFKIISWSRHFYAWDSSIVPWLRNQLGVNLRQLAEIRNSRDSLRKFYDYRMHYEDLPMAYNSFIHKDIIIKVKSIHNRYFDTHCPDSFSGIVNAYFSDQYLYSQRSLSITGTSGHSNGASQLFPALSDDPDWKKANSNLMKTYHEYISLDISAPIPVTPETAVADVQLQAKDIFFPDDDEISLNIKAYIKTITDSINRDTSIYEVMKDYIIGLAHKYDIDISTITIPEKAKEFYGQKFQGIAFDAQGRPGHLRVNCEQAGIFNVADAAKLAQSILPDYSKLQVIEASDLNHNKSDADAKILPPTILIDAVFFQFYKTGIARVWTSLLEQWSKTNFARHILVLDRANTAPKIPGIRYRTIPAYSYDKTGADRAMLQKICDEESAAVFISTYYTTPETTPSVFMAYDMIPEVLKFNLQDQMWREKHHAIRHASAYISISESTARDLNKFFPEIPAESVRVAHCGVSEQLNTATQEQILNFKTKYGLHKPYFLLVGSGFTLPTSYKNGSLFFKAFSQLINHNTFDIICTGASALDPNLRQYTSGSVVHLLTFTDAELRLAYAGATALIFPSLYEGFGMPIVEAMACGCPVITCSNSSIPEAAGEAALYVNETDVTQMADALCEVQKPSVRERLIHAGLQQAQKFTWNNMAEKVSTALLEVTLISLKLREINYIICPDWSQPEELIAELLAQTLVMVASSSDKEKITLLIGLEGIEAETADLLVSSVAMNLLMTTDLDISEGPEVSLIDQLSDLQWQILLPKLHKRIQLKQENQSLIDSKLNELPLLALG
jgi:glycosyltransferase involved in cell wall biosynthesis